ncbi:MAG: DUF4349 domain-containing protein [Anaerolineales bacterium]
MSHPNHTTIKILTFLAISALLLAACSQASAPQMAPGEGGSDVVFRDTTGELAPEEPRLASGQEQQDVERLVIKNADLSLIVPDPGSSMDHISALAEELGGFVVTANLYTQRLETGVEVPRANITIRVPAVRLNDALQRIKQESDQVPRQESINSQDVTQEYTDLQSRLRNLEEAEAQLREIMESANRTEDVLSVYNELVRVREQIEVLKGQIQYYEQSAALSAISVELIANEAAQPLTIGTWQPGGVVRQAIQALISATKFIINAAIWVVIFVLPIVLLLLVIFVLPVYLVVRAWRRRRQARAQAHQKSEPAQPDPTEK